MHLGVRLSVRALLAVPLLLLAGCGANDLPPGGAEAVGYWHSVLQQHPDLPDKVRTIVNGSGRVDWTDHSLPGTEVWIHGENDSVAVAGSQVDIVVTDLDDDTLRKLLKWWESVPDWAKKLGLSPRPPVFVPSSTRQIVVLGRQGRIEVSGPTGQNSQSIQVLSDDAGGRTTIGIHTFGPDGPTALEQLASQYQRVRGPPWTNVKAGYVSLPPPQANVTVLVIGQLGSLDIGGPSDDASQQISVAAYMNRHWASDPFVGLGAGVPFPVETPDVVQSPEAEPSTTGELAGESSIPSAEAIPAAEAVQPVSPMPEYRTVEVPRPITIPGTIDMPKPIELPKFEYRPIQTPTPIFVPPPVFQPPPVVVPHFR